MAHCATRYAAEADVRWHATPTVSLHLEFRWRGATALFRLQLDAEQRVRRHPASRTRYARVDEATAHRFAEALADARLFPPALARPTMHFASPGQAG